MAASTETTEAKNGFIIRAYTKKELRLLYGIPKSTFRRWLIPLRDMFKSKNNNWLNAAEVELFVNEYGFPGQKQFS